MKRQLFQRQRFRRLETPLWSPTMNYRGGSVSEGFARTLLGLRSLPMTLSSFCRSLFLLLVMYFFLSLFLSEPQWPPHHTTIPTFSNTSLLVSTIIFNISVCSVYKNFPCVCVWTLLVEKWSECTCPLPYTRAGTHAASVFLSAAWLLPIQAQWCLCYGSGGCRLGLCPGEKSSWPTCVFIQVALCNVYTHWQMLICIPSLSFSFSLGDMGVGKSCLLHQFTEKKCKYFCWIPSVHLCVKCECGINIIS